MPYLVFLVAGPASLRTFSTSSSQTRRRKTSSISSRALESLNGDGFCEKTARQFDIDDHQVRQPSPRGADGRALIRSYTEIVIGIGISSGLK